MATENVPLFPLSNALFPKSVLYLNIFEVRYLHLMRRAQSEGIEFGIVPLAQGNEVQRAGEVETLHEWGCLARLELMEEIQPAVLAVKCVGTQRFKLAAHSRGAYGLWSGELERVVDTPSAMPTQYQSLADRLGALIAQSQREGFEDRLPMQQPYELEDAGWVSDRWASLLPLSAEQKVELLAERDPVKRLEILSRWI
jgi:Lon protease-like protein